MELEEFKRYINNLDQYTAAEVDSFELMTGEELNAYQHELEIDSGNLSDWDHLRAIITLRKMVVDCHANMFKLYDIKENEIK